MKHYLADTNFILRYLLNDIPTQANEAEKYLSQAKKKKIKLFFPSIVIFQIIFVLSSVYSFPKERLIDELKSMLIADYLQIENRDVFISGLYIWKEEIIDYVDAFLVASAINSKQQLLTFDKKLVKVVQSL